QHDASDCLVVKFGGSSLANGEKIANAVRAVVKELERGAKVVVVVSAIGKTTDFLLDVAKEAINCNGAELNNDIDDVLAMGERTSARLFSTILKANGVKCRYFDPADSDWPIITNDRPMNADPILPACEELITKYVMPLLKDNVVVIVPGFVGKTLDGKITTMGRGGSDTTALVLARALNAKQVILVTDVDGIMTADPKLVKSPRKVPHIDVNSLIGLASCGKKFLQRKALKYKDDGIDIKIVNNIYCDLNAEGTIITGSVKNDVVSLDFPEPIASITVVGKAISQSPKVLHEILQKTRSSDSSLLGISANYDSLILYVPEKMLEEIIEPLHTVVLENSEAIALAVRRNLALLKIKTAELEETPGIISALARVLNAKGINIYGLFTVASGIHVFVERESVEEALTAVRKSVEEGFDLSCNPCASGR
ncbi:MAG: aspartate kinase, partial [Candidatus Bathyarchaeia archaeon]